MSIGKLETFDVRGGNWSQYVERMEEFFNVNKVEEEMKVSTLITVIGAECYELLVNLCTPKKPKEKSFKELSLLLENHLQPQPSILAERYKFRNRKQEHGESIADYVTIDNRLN
ncbi:hypothetical protein NE865_14146 [Phthorimaea operculella]|nr:hypothetical protein NE865_14146 [Phthorimaea operculella]